MLVLNVIYKFSVNSCLIRDTRCKMQDKLVVSEEYQSVKCKSKNAKPKVKT